GLQDACRQGRDQGFDGKTLIHPRQIGAANLAFAPTPDELDTARKRLDAWKAAQAEGKGVAVVDGALVENLHASEAERVLALAAAIQAP
ncbi:MAG TPA: CoA ester lyase, partial [Achromobacter sp.]|nr:CoA ester lyase [Achromobacter sp.]